MKKVQSGFTLIELMISVAIVGILASVAIPSFQDNTRTANAAHMVTAAQSFAKASQIAVQGSEVVNTAIALGSNGVPTEASLIISDTVSTAAVAGGVLTLTGTEAKLGTGNTVLTVTIGTTGAAAFTGNCVTNNICKI